MCRYYIFADLLIRLILPILARADYWIIDCVGGRYESAMDYLI